MEGVRVSRVDEMLCRRLQREVRPKPEPGSARHSWCPQPNPCSQGSLVGSVAEQGCVLPSPTPPSPFISQRFIKRSLCARLCSRH